MKISFPSPEFDDAVASVCHGAATEAEMAGLNELLRSNPTARDEYLLRIELHTRLASDPELFSRVEDADAGWRLPDRRRGIPESKGPLPSSVRAGKRRAGQILALAACLMIFAGVAWMMWFRGTSTREGPTSTAVAMLTRAVDAQWDDSMEAPRVGGALKPGTVRLNSGLAQIVFYSGARVVIAGPAELQLISAEEAFCNQGRLLVEVPLPAGGFRTRTPQVSVVEAGTSFGIKASRETSEVHVFRGKADLVLAAAAKRSVNEGQAVVVQTRGQPRVTTANAELFSALFEFHQRSLASEAFRYEQWQFANAKLNEDSSLLVHLEFETSGGMEWRVRNTAEGNRTVTEAIIVGCARSEGRWREKQALEFQSVNDRVRLAVPGKFGGLTLSAWVCIKGLDRQFNSIFMSDGFDAGTVHWLIRNDGVLGLTVFGEWPGEFQILPSPPVLSLERLGMWQHLAATVDGDAQEVVHYLNGSPVSRHALRIGPPFRVGSAELGNWNARSGPNTEPSLIRNLSGSLDEFELFSRALSDAEIHELYLKGKPDL